MKHCLDLNGTWKIRGFDGQHGVPESFCGDEAVEKTFVDAVVPGEIHIDLENAGWIDDVNVGLNAQKARWVEEQVWVYRKRFNVSKSELKQHAFLIFDGLDLYADIYLNCEKIGSHNNSFKPCKIDVTGKLREGENLIAVRIESGLYAVSERSGIEYQSALDHQLHKRSWLRKPQCSFSWDWSPRLVNVGIYKDIRLEFTDNARFDAITVYPTLSDNHKTGTIHTVAHVESVIDKEAKGVLKMTVKETGQTVEMEMALQPGTNRMPISVEISNPKLWWPLPHGEQNLYHLEFELSVNGKSADKSEKRTGIRSVRLNLDPHPEVGNYFIIEINGKPIFCKGGNWVPADLLFARVTKDHYRNLVKLAVDANFNALRIWGGGLYADHDFLDACDEMGVIVWHDFIFACSKYPADNPEFLNNVREELAFQVKDLSPHPSLAVWCGNNELEWAAWDWGFDQFKAYPDYALYHHEMPRIVKREDPSRPFWPSSPYSENNAYPQDRTTGDQHPWHVTLAEDGPNFRAYRTNVSRFPNEGGVLGASGPATLKQFLPEEHLNLWSPVWEFHENACNYWTEDAITYKIFEHWMGKKAEDVDFWDYCYYSALLQAEGLKEYADNFRRRMFSSSSAIFWMYNDVWPTSHGWTIVDYYLRKKISYHPVRRAFQAINIIPCIDGGRVLIIGVNDTLRDWKGEARYGMFDVEGALRSDQSGSVVLKANSATLIASFSLAAWEQFEFERTGYFAILCKNGETIAQNRLFNAPYSAIPWKDKGIQIERKGNKVEFCSDAFVWGVTLDWDGDKDIADDVFDLLPGIPYAIDWPKDKELPQIERIGSKIPWL